MKASILDLRRNMSEVIRCLDSGEKVTILYRGKEKGVLIPAATEQEQVASVSEHPAFGMWAEREDMDDVATHVRSLRKGRF